MLPTKFRFICPRSFRGEDFFNWPIRDQKCLWWPCLLTDRDKMCNLYRGPSIEASYQVSVHLAKGFQRRRLKCEKLMDDRRRMMDDGWRTTDAKWWQKLSLPLARWANKIKYIYILKKQEKIHIDKKKQDKIHVDKINQDKIHVDKEQDKIHVDKEQDKIHIDKTG